MGKRHHHSSHRRFMGNTKDAITAPALLVAELKLYGFSAVMSKGGDKVAQVKCDRCGRHVHHGTIQAVRDHAATH